MTRWFSAASGGPTLRATDVNVVPAAGAERQLPTEADICGRAPAAALERDDILVNRRRFAGGLFSDSSCWLGLEASSDDQTLFDGFTGSGDFANFGWRERSVGGLGIEHQCGDGGALVTA